MRLYGLTSQICVLGTALALGLGAEYTQPALARSKERVRDEAAIARELAVQKLRDARAAFAQRQYAEALSLAEESLRLDPAPKTRNLLGAVLANPSIGQYARAYREFQTSIRDCEKRVKEDDLKLGDNKILADKRFAEEQLEALKSSVAWLKLLVPSEVPSGFTLHVGSSVVPPEDWNIELPQDSGSVSVIAEGPRLAKFEQTVKLVEGAHVAVEVKLLRETAAILRVRVQTLPNELALKLDGTEQKLNPLGSTYYVEPGAHRLELRQPGYSPYRWQGDLANDETRSVDISLRPKKKLPKWIFYTALSAAGGSLVLGCVLGGLAYSREGQIVSKELLSEVNGYAISSTVFFSVGGTLLVSAIPLAFAVD